LFFLDEVTALAAGHRPCFYCRRDAARRFQRCFEAGNGLEAAAAPAMNDILHRQRPASGGTAPLISPDEVERLPDGAMVAVGGQAFAIMQGAVLPWSHSGYGQPITLPERASLLTPAATVAALRAGYRPAWACGAAASGTP